VTQSQPAPIGAVLFDLFHTLVDMSSAPPDTATHDLLGVSAEAWAEQIFYHAPHHALGTETDPYDSVRQIAHAIDPTIPEERIRRAVDARPLRFRAALLNVRPAILDAIGRLRALGLKIGLISNAGLDEVEAWEESPLAPLFDVVLFSCHEGVMKPDREIYQRAASRLGLPPERCLFVGDGGSHEHEGARAAGMTTLLALWLLHEADPQLARKRKRVTDYVADTVEEMMEVARSLRDGQGSGEK